MNERKPACIFYIVKNAVGRCILNETEGGIEKFNIYEEWNLDKAMRFSFELHGCPFIPGPESNLFSDEDIREQCNRCSKRVQWSRQHKEEIEAQYLESRSF